MPRPSLAFGSRSLGEPIDQAGGKPLVSADRPEPASAVESLGTALAFTPEMHVPGPIRNPDRLFWHPGL